MDLPRRTGLGPSNIHRAWLREEARAPALPFGSEASYTTWRYDALEVTGTQDGAVATVSLANTGERAGAEVVQVYLSRPDSAVERPVRWLAGFTKVRAGAGRTVTVEVPLPGGDRRTGRGTAGGGTRCVRSARGRKRC
ncbi:fibronectin type III-like domain-contianing protein [Spirillospora sp. CA-255316]